MKLENLRYVIQESDVNTYQLVLANRELDNLIDRVEELEQQVKNNVALGSVSCSNCGDKIGRKIFCNHDCQDEYLSKCNCN